MAITLLASGNGANRQKGINSILTNENSTFVSPYNAITSASQATEQASQNNGGFFGGIGYLGHKIGLGFLSGIEGIWDYTAGGLADLFGADDWAERQFANDWVDYNSADEWFNPSSGWQTAGDVAGGIGTSLPALAGAAAGAATIYFSGGSLSGVGAKLIISSISAGIAGLGAAGNATKEAYRETGELNGAAYGYGALSGITEAGIEFATAGIGKGTGRIISSLGKTAAKETAETVAKTGVKTIFKQIGEDFATEAFEEGLAEFLSPVYQRMTYNPDAENASAQEIFYAAMVGGLSGMVMSGSSIGINAGVNTTVNYFSGKKAAESGTYAGVIEAGRALADAEGKNDTNIEAFQSAQDTYNKLTESLKKNNGIATTEELLERVKAGNITFKAKDLMYLGKLKRTSVIAHLHPYIERSARGLVFNAENAAQRYAAFGMTDANGKPIRVTAEQILSGIDASLVEKAKAGTLTDTEAKTFAKSLRKALSENSTLATLAVAEATGGIIMDTRRMAEAMLNGENLANTADLNRLIEKGKPEEMQALGQALGIEDWSKVTIDELRARVAEFNANGGISEFAEQSKRMRRALEQGAESAKPLPHLLRKNMQDGVYRYTSEDGSVNMAIFKEGDTYRLYDYDGDNISRALSAQDVNQVLKRFWTSGQTTTAKSMQFTEETNLARETTEIDAYAAKNIPDYNSMSEPNKAAIRMTVRQARAHGLTDAEILVFAKVAAKSGLNVIFDAERAFGDGAISGNTIYVNPNNSEARTYEVILGHEMFHKLFADGDKRAMQLFTEARDLLERSNPEKAKEVRERYKKFYKKLGTDSSVAQAISEEEVAAAGAEEVFRSADAWAYILSKEPSFADKVLSFFRKSAREYSSVQGLSAQARKFVRQYKALFESLSERNQGNNALSIALEGAGVKKMPVTNTETDSMHVTGDEEERVTAVEKDAEAAKELGDISDARFSLVFSEDIAQKQREYVDRGYAKISVDELQSAIDDTSAMVEKMLPYSNILPQDKVGKTLVKNGSYDVSVENTTICIRTLAYNSFVDMVSEKVGRPLTQMESFLVSQKLYEIAKEPQCLYCYVSLDRKAFNEMIIRYTEQRDAAIEAYEDAGKPKLPNSFDAEWSLFKSFLDGRKPTKNMWDRYVGWIEAYNKGEKLVTLEDISTEAKRLEIVENGGYKAGQVKDMLKYAQSASWAKKQTQYVAYYDEILKLKPQVIRNLNSHYGMRWYSFSDYSGAFIVENMQQITDASIRGLKGLSYTKDTDFAEIFAPTGMNINISVYVKKNKDGGYEIDPKQSANIDEAIKLRKQYSNVGIVAVATDTEGVEWALAQEWSDVVIPFHTVRTGADVAEFYNWEIFNAEQSDTVTDQSLWDAYVDSVGKKKASKMVYPSEHQNDRDTYLRICKERGLTPRFKSFLDNPNYMKLVNETRQSESETQPLKPKYSLDAAKRSFDKFVKKGGYYEGWYNDGIDVDGEADIVAEDVKAGRKANEVSYGRQDINYDDLTKGRKKNRQHGTSEAVSGERFALADESYPDAVERGDMVTAQRMVDEAAKAAGYDVTTYHGTDKNFTVFKTLYTNEYGYHVGTKQAAEDRVRYTLNSKILKLYTKLGNTIRTPDVFGYFAGMHDYIFYVRGETSKVSDMDFLKQYGRTRKFSNKFPTNETLDMLHNAYVEFVESGYKYSKGRAVVELTQEYLKSIGVDSVAYTNAYESKGSTSYLLLHSNQVKSADPVTFDENGATIPLSERFNTESPDIRYALDIENINVSWYNEIKLNAFEQERIQSEALTWDAKYRNELRRRTLTDGFTYRYIIDDDGIVHVLDREKSINIHERGEYYANTDRERLDTIAESLRSEPRRYSSGVGFAEDRRESSTDDRGDYKPLRREGRSNGAGYSENWFSSHGRSKAGIQEPYLKVVHTFTDITGRKRNILKVSSNEYMIEGDTRSRYQPTIETAIKAENERIIDRYAKKKDKSKSFVKAKLAIDPDFLKGFKFALTGNEDLDALLSELYSDTSTVFDVEAILERGIPRKPGASTLTIGEMKKTIANNTHYQVFSKGKALEVIGRMFGTSDLTAKTRAKLADALWQGFNDCTDAESRQTFAHDMAEYIVATMVTEAKVENPDVMEAQERLSYLSTYIGKISFHPEYLSEIRHIADKAGLKKILGRWGYKGKKGTSRVPMDVFTVDIAREMPGMSELEDMHPVEAFMELDAMYERAREDVKDKWISAYWEATDADMLAIVSGIEADIMRAFETEGEQSKFSKLVENRIEYYSARAEFWKAEHDKIKGRDRILGLLMSQAQKMKDLRLGTFANATQFDSELFKNSIEKLAKIQFRGNLNVSGTRKIMGELLQWYRKDNPLLEFVDDKNPGLYVQSVADMLESLSEGKKGFSKEELLTMYDVMSYFVKFVENYGKVFRNGKMIEALPEAQRYIGIAQANEGLKVGLFAKLSGSWYAEMFSDPATLVRRMDYYERGFYTEMFEDLREAATDAEIAEMRIMREYDEFLRSNKKYIEKASEDLIEYRGQKIPKIQLIDLYMTMKRKHAWAGIAINGFPFKNLEGKVVRVPGFLPDEHISETDLEAAITAQQAEIAKHFTDADRQYMAILEKGYNEDARKLKADRDMQRLGFTNASTDYYYPIRRAYTAQNIDASDAQAEYDRVTNSSFNKDIVKGAKQEIAIESADARFRRHIHAVCQYAYLSPAIETFNRLYNMDTSGNRNHPVSVRTATENGWARGNKYFMKLISDIQGIPTGSSEGMAELSFIRGSYAKFQLGANPKVWFTQLSSIFASSSILDADSITRGAFLSSEGIDQYCPLAELRRYENTAAMAQGVLDKQGKARSKAGRAIQKAGKFSDVLMQPIGMMDRFVVCRIFGACQAQVEKNGGAKVGTEANKIEAGKLLRKVIQETQQNSIATERSAAMRSSNEILRTVTMFTSDSMKVIGRVIDAFGEISVLHSKIKAATDPDVKADLKASLKVAKKNARKATTALVLTAVFMAAIAQLFRHIYDKEQKEDETVAQTMIVDAIGNLFGGLPIFKDIYATFAEGYDIDNYTYSAVNDLISGVKSIVDLVGLICENKATQQDYASRIKKVSYAVGQITGLPVRNVYNVLYGLTKRFNPEVAYKIDNVFYEKNYKNDFYKAIEDEDAEMASFILSLLYNERMGVDRSEAVHNELYSLSAKGYKVLPKSAPKSITVEGAEYELSEAQQAAVRGSYSASQVSLEKLFTKEKYKKLTDEMKAEAVNYVYDLHYNMALEDALGIDRGNAVLISSVIGAENLAMLHVATMGLTSDTDKFGNAISGSKRQKVVAAINQLDVSSEQKLLLICAKGYALKDGDLRGLSAERAKKLLLRYILRMGKLNKQQKAELAALCGFEVRNGRIMLKTPS